MAQKPNRRTLAAALFTDIVNSTAIAEELGDKRWKAVVDGHHRAVRRELKRFGGTEQDTAGDGFFASFREPASAIACACAASEAVHELGLDIRAGVHFGECERFGRKLGGINVVVAARIMALGGAADVLVSSTAAELARGGGFTFVDRGSHALKGVDGEWRVMGVVAVDDRPREGAVDPDDAKRRREMIVPVAERRRRGVVVGVAVAFVVVAFVAIVLARRTPHAVSRPSAGSLARIDPSGTFGATVSLGAQAYPDAIAAGGGKLWVADAGNQTLAAVDPTSDQVQVWGTPSTPTGVAFDDGRVWITYGFSSDPRRVVDAFDPSHPALAPAGILVPIDSYPIAAGTSGLWIADPAASITSYDPVTQATQTFPLPPGDGPVDVAVGTGSSGVWVASGREPVVLQVDPRSGTTRSFDTGHVVPSALTIAPGGTVWVVSGQSDAVVALAPDGTTKVQETLGAGCDDPIGVAATSSAIWLSCEASRAVVRLDPADGSITATLPVDGGPGPIVAETDGSVWVAVR